MSLALRYGRDGFDIELPPDLDATILRLNPLPPLADEAAAIAEAFAKPIGTPPLYELARGRQSACIAICDVTRPVPNEKILTPMLQTFSRAI